MNYCKTKHQCADGNEGECNQLQNHMGKHLCSNCLTFFAGAATSPPELQGQARVGIHFQSPGIKSGSDDTDGALRPGFCAHCGKRLDSDEKWCGKCGAETAAGAGISGDHGVAGGSAGEIPDIGKPVFPLNPRDLDLIVNYSLMNAPLDTAFLLVQSKITKAWMPLGFINDLEGLVAYGGGRLLYVPDASVDEFCMPNELRVRPVTIRILSTFEKFKDSPFVEILVFPVFKHVTYGAIESDIRGKWATILDDRGVQDVRAVLQMPLSGKYMKQRLTEHWFELDEEIRKHENSDDPEVRGYARFYRRRVAGLRRIHEEMPDGHPDHIYCIASVLHRGRLQNTIVAETKTPPHVGSGAASRILRESRIMSVLSQEDPQARERKLRLQQNNELKPAGKSTDARSPVPHRDDLRSDV